LRYESQDFHHYFQRTCGAHGSSGKQPVAFERAAIAYLAKLDRRPRPRDLKFSIATPPGSIVSEDVLGYQELPARRDVP
jgi:hypothetical protein